VKALVYVDAYLPARGETLEQLNNAQPGSCVASTSVLTTAPCPGATNGDVDTYVKQSWFTGCFANGLPAAEGAELAAEQQPTAASTFTEPSGVPAWKTIPSWDLIGTADRVLVPAEQLYMAQRAHAHITEIKAPHLSMLYAPGSTTSRSRSLTARRWRPGSTGSTSSTSGTPASAGGRTGRTPPSCSATPTTTSSNSPPRNMWTRLLRP
jgi:pimeloyl-ACP methyl ester carboxylesterase